MASSHRNRTPSTLDPYLALPPAQTLTLLTNTLGTSANWLTSRFAISALNDASNPVSVVLVSWMRDLAFWKDELRRAAVGGMNRRSTSGRVATSTRNSPVDTQGKSAQGLDISRTPTFHFVDMLSASLSSSSSSSSSSPKSSPSNTNPLSSVEQTITSALAQAGSSSSNALLILDYPSLLLATNPSVTSTSLSNLILTLRSHPSVHSTLLTNPADGPFLSASLPDTNVSPTPVESESAAFAVQQAHSARSVLGVRELGTGAARDVSGVLRVTKGGKCDEGVREWEGLYLVGRDGGVKMVE